MTVVTLLVTPQQAECLTLASTEGKIQLALRNPLDASAPPTPGVKPAILLGAPALTAPRPMPRAISSRSSRKPQPAPAAAAPEPTPTIEIIRGEKRAYEPVR